MSEETKTIITVALLVFAAAAWIWPLALGIHLEQEPRAVRAAGPSDYLDDSGPFRVVLLDRVHSGHDAVRVNSGLGRVGFGLHSP